MKVETRREFFVLRKGSGVQRAQRMGKAWPVGGEVHVKRDRHALVFPDGSFRVMRSGTYEDAVASAYREAAVGKHKGTVTVARAVGTYGQANLYEAGLSFSPDDVGFTDPVREHWLKRVKELGKTEDDIRYRFGVFHTVAPEGKAAKRGTNLKIQGLASTPDIDRDQEIIDPNAFADALPMFLENPVMLFMHQHLVPIGFWTEISVGEDGVTVKGEVVDEQIKDWIETRGLKMLSVGFIPLDGDFKQTPDGGVWIISKAELLEVSVVTIPANPFARFEVAKSVKLRQPENEAANCCHGEMYCTCPSRAGVVEYRRFPVAAIGCAWEADQGASRKAMGQEAMDLCDSWEAENGDPSLQHAALVEGELMAIPELVRCSMAEVVAYHGDWAQEDREALWATMGRRWMDCFPEEPIPTIDKHPAPGQFKRIVQTDALLVQAVVLDRETFSSEADAKKWARDHGFKTTATTDTLDGYRFQQFKAYPKCEHIRLRFDAGVTGILARVDADPDVDQDDDTPEGSKEEVLTMKRSELEALIEATVAKATGKGADGDDDDTKKDDDTPKDPAGKADPTEEMVEVDEDVAEALDEIDEALKEHGEVEITDPGEFQRVTAAAANALGVETEEVEIEE